MGILALRLTVGTLLAARGAQKLFGWFGGGGLGGTPTFPVRSATARPSSSHLSLA